MKLTDIDGPDGLTHIFATIKETEDIRQLPSNYQAVIEWARISYVLGAIAQPLWMYT